MMNPRRMMDTAYGCLIGGMRLRYLHGKHYQATGRNELPLPGARKILAGAEIKYWDYIGNAKGWTGYLNTWLRDKSMSKYKMVGAWVYRAGKAVDELEALIAKNEVPNFAEEVPYTIEAAIDVVRTRLLAVKEVGTFLPTANYGAMLDDLIW